MSKEVENYIEQAKNNIVEDRAATKTLLMNLMKYMQTSDDRHREVGLVAAKYLETLQRSNEQLVKLAALVQKKTTSENITEEDKQSIFDMIKEESEHKSRIQLKNNQNQTCVLTPGTSSSGGCTWRSQRQCKQVPTVTRVPVFSPWCADHGDSGHLANCHETIQRRPLVHSVRVCTPTGAPDCRGPCYQCPQYCEPVQQSWCEVSHSISTVLMEKTECDYNNDEGRGKLQLPNKVQKQ